MTRYKLFGAVAILSALIATPALAQRMIEEPGMFAFTYPNGDLGIGSSRPAGEARASLVLNANRHMNHLGHKVRPAAARRY